MKTDGDLRISNNEEEDVECVIMVGNQYFNDMSYRKSTVTLTSTLRFALRFDITDINGLIDYNKKLLELGYKDISFVRIKTIVETSVYACDMEIYNSVNEIKLRVKTRVKADE